MKKLSTLIVYSQQKMFYLFLILLLISGAVLPALAQTSPKAYSTYITEATTALDNGDTRAAYHALAKARKQARKYKDKAHQDAFRVCLKKIPFYENYIPLVEAAEAKLSEEDFKNAQNGLLVAKEQLDLSMELEVDIPDFVEYEKNKRLALEQRMAAIDARRIPLLEGALVSGEDKFLQNRPGEALEDFKFARSLALDQSNEPLKYRIGERIQKAELHYDVYTQINLARREAGLRRYRQAQVIFQDALAKIEQSKDYYFPRLADLDYKKHQEVQQLIDGVDTKRTKTYQMAIARGQEYLEQNQPAEALKAFNYAKQQMFKDLREYQATSIDPLIDQSHYTLFIDEGDQYLKQKNYTEAIAAYEQAQEKVKTEEITFKIQQAKDGGYQNALALGRQAFAQGYYAEAQGHYKGAATFKNSPELKNLLTQHYGELLQQGQMEMDRAAYADAQAYFENARLFSDTREVQEMLGQVQGGMDYETAYVAAEQYLREGRMEAAKASFEEARSYRNSVEVQDQLFAIEDYEIALTEGRRALDNDDSELARAYFQNAQDIYNTPEINDWLRQTGSRIEEDRLAVQSYNTEPILASSRTLIAKGIGSGSINFDFNTVMWMRPDCSLDWTVEFYNEYGSLTGTQNVTSQCSFTFSNLPDGTYTYQLKLRDNGKTSIYRTNNNEVQVWDGEKVRVKIDAKE